jgi:hypothetical protein
MMNNVITLYLERRPTTAEAESRLVCIGTSRTAHVKGLKALKVVVGASPLKVCMALLAGHLDDLKLAVKRMHFCYDIEYLRITLVIVGNLGNQSPVARLLGQFNGLVLGC